MSERTLAASHCVPVRKDSDALAEKEISELRPQVSEWTLFEQDGVQRLQRVFKFKDFAKALAFTNQVGAITEAEDHHPAILTEWGKVTITWWTHVIKGLHRNDFIMAAKTDSLSMQ
jgi:4a-hydroxytetrahydrobiopterin dehydratase